MIFSHKDTKKSNPNKHFWKKVTKSKEIFVSIKSNYQRMITTERVFQCLSVTYKPS